MMDLRESIKTPLSEMDAERRKRLEELLTIKYKLWARFALSKKEKEIVEKITKERAGSDKA